MNSEVNKVKIEFYPEDHWDISISVSILSEGFAWISEYSYDEAKIKNRRRIRIEKPLAESIICFVNDTFVQNEYEYNYDSVCSEIIFRVYSGKKIIRCARGVYGADEVIGGLIGKIDDIIKNDKIAYEKIGLISSR